MVSANNLSRTSTNLYWCTFGFPYLFFINSTYRAPYSYTS